MQFTRCFVDVILKMAEPMRLRQTDRPAVVSNILPLFGSMSLKLYRFDAAATATIRFPAIVYSLLDLRHNRIQT